MPSEPFANRTVGALFIAFAMGSLFAYQKNNWEQAEIVVLMDLIWLILGLIGTIWSMSYIRIGVAVYLIIGLFVLLILLFGYTYYEAKMKV